MKNFKFGEKSNEILYNAYKKVTFLKNAFF